jgi:polyisoprenoid-binding protein YceI
VAKGSEFSFFARFEEQELQGAFSTFSVNLDRKPGAMTETSLEARVDVTTADMDDKDINEAIATAEWFDYGEHPVAVFNSTDIQVTPTGAYLAHGEMELKGIRRSVVVPFTWVEDEVGEGKRATMSGAFVLSRTDFGIGSGEWAEDDSIGYAVRVRFSIAMSCDEDA